MLNKEFKANKNLILDEEGKRLYKILSKMPLGESRLLSGYKFKSKDGKIVSPNYPDLKFEKINLYQAEYDKSEGHDLKATGVDSEGQLYQIKNNSIIKLKKLNESLYLDENTKKLYRYLQPGEEYKDIAVRDFNYFDRESSFSEPNPAFSSEKRTNYYLNFETLGDYCGSFKDPSTQNEYIFLNLPKSKDPFQNTLAYNLKDNSFSRVYNVGPSLVIASTIGASAYDEVNLKTNNVFIPLPKNAADKDKIEHLVLRDNIIVNDKREQKVYIQPVYQKSIVPLHQFKFYVPEGDLAEIKMLGSAARHVYGIYDGQQTHVYETVNIPQLEEYGYSSMCLDTEKFSLEGKDVSIKTTLGGNIYKTDKDAYLVKGSYVERVGVDGQVDDNFIEPGF